MSKTFDAVHCAGVEPVLHTGEPPMIKRTLAAFAITAAATLGFAASASANDQCPTTATCGGSMPTVPVLQNPLATTTTTSKPATTTTTATPTTTTSTSTSTPSSSTTGVTVATVPVLTAVGVTPTVPLNTGTLATPAIPVPTLTAPPAVTTPSSTQNVPTPVLPVPNMSWGNANVSATPAPVTPNYPAVNNNDNTGSSAVKPNRAPAPAVAVQPQAAEPSAATPSMLTGETRGLPWGTLTIVALGGLIGVVGRTMYDRAGTKLASRRSS
jgi:hypothetical protein